MASCSDLRFVEPLSAEVIALLQKAANSPAYIKDDRLRSHVAFIAGGILRRLVAGAILELSKRDSEQLRNKIWHSLWVPMAKSCDMCTMA